MIEDRKILDRYIKLLLLDTDEIGNRVEYFKEIEIIEKQILDGLKALEELPKLKEKLEKSLANADDDNTDLQKENQKLKAELSERVSTANKIIAEKIDEIKLLKELIESIKKDRDVAVEEQKKYYELKKRVEDGIVYHRKEAESDVGGWAYDSHCIKLSVLQQLLGEKN